MIIILKQNANPTKVEELKQDLVAQGFKLHLSEGTQATLIGLIGDTSHVHEDWLRALDVVDSVRRIREPYMSSALLILQRATRLQDRLRCMMFYERTPAVNQKPYLKSTRAPHRPPRSPRRG